jgi:hypothetical protein
LVIEDDILPCGLIGGSVLLRKIAKPLYLPDVTVAAENGFLYPL